MYWYYKYGFVALVIIVVGGIAWLLRDSLPNLPTRGDDETSIVADGDGAMTQTVTGDTGAPIAKPASAAIAGAQTARVSTDPPPEYAVNAISKLDLARKQLDANEPVLARKVLESILRDPNLPTYSDPWMQTADLLSEVNTRIMMTDVPCEEKVTYVVEKGDSVWKIAKHLNVTMQMVMRGNALEPTDPKVFPGQTLKIYKADWRILVSKSHYLLELRDGDRLVKLYHIGLGRQDRTPVGTFRIATKEREPVWTYRGKRYAYGDPQNVLGTRWMGLEPVGTTSALLEGYGIHGTKEPDSIGQAMSNGCVRMLNEQVEELFDIVPYNTQVEIVE